MNVVASGLPSSSYARCFEERAADALHHAARDLALDDARVDHRPAVLAHDVAQERDAARLDVDLARAHVGGVDPDRPARRRCSARSPRARPGRRAAASTARSRRASAISRERDADRRRAAHAARGCRPARCRRPRLRACARRWRTMRSRRIVAVSRIAPAVIDPLRLPAAPAPKPVTAVSPWIVLTSSMFDAERVGGELDDRGLDAVPGRAARDVHVDRARRLDADRRRLGRVVAEARRRRLDVVRHARRRGSGRRVRASACSARNAS